VSFLAGKSRHTKSRNRLVSGNILKNAVKKVSKKITGKPAKKNMKKTVMRTHTAVARVSKGKKVSISKKLDKVLNIENQLLLEEKRIESREKNIQKDEQRLEQLEQKAVNEERSENREIERLEEEIESKESKEESELEKLERLEKEIKNEVGEHPLTHITSRDIIKGCVGAFIGLAIHYTFTYGVEISHGLSFTRASILFPFTFIVGLLFIYATGFRKVKDPKILIFMPLRLMILYVCAIVMSIVVLFLFYPEFAHDFIESYKMVAGVMLAAVVGACTADLLGKE
jgi:uncharacterized membrane protein